MSAKKPTSKKVATTQATPSASKKPQQTTGTADIKLLKGTPSTKRPPNNPDVPQATIDQLNEVLNQIKTSSEQNKIYPINAWSFAKGKTPKLYGVAV